MPTEATPDRHTEVAANRTAEAAERTKETAVRTTVAALQHDAPSRPLGHHAAHRPQQPISVGMHVWQKRAAPHRL
jgi:hypothetical protein